MELEPGGLYKLTKKYFRDVTDPNIMRGYDKGRSYAHDRPHLFVFADKDTGLAWFVPCTHEKLNIIEKTLV